MISMTHGLADPRSRDVGVETSRSWSDKRIVEKPKFFLPFLLGR